MKKPSLVMAANAALVLILLIGALLVMSSLDDLSFVQQCLDDGGQIIQPVKHDPICVEVSGP